MLKSFSVEDAMFAGTARSNSSKISKSDARLSLSGDPANRYYDDPWCVTLWAHFTSTTPELLVVALEGRFKRNGGPRLLQHPTNAEQCPNLDYEARTRGCELRMRPRVVAIATVPLAAPSLARLDPGWGIRAAGIPAKPSRVAISSPLMIHVSRLCCTQRDRKRADPERNNPEKGHAFFSGAVPVKCGRKNAY